MGAVVGSIYGDGESGAGGAAVGIMHRVVDAVADGLAGFESLDRGQRVVQIETPGAVTIQMQGAVFGKVRYSVRVGGCRAPGGKALRCVSAGGVIVQNVAVYQVCRGIFGYAGWISHGMRSVVSYIDGDRCRIGG